MKNEKLSKIKLKAQKLFVEKDIKSINEFLRAELEQIDNDLFNQVILFEGNRNALLRDKKEKLITSEQFQVQQNLQRKAISVFINDLDAPKQKESTPYKVSEKQLLKWILFFQLLILLGVGILIYMLTK